MMLSNSKRLLIICQKVDEQDDLLGFFVGWIREFQRYFQVEVVALHGPQPRPKLVRWMVFVWNVLRAARRSDAVFCHMSPIFAVIAALGGKPVSLWYLHRSVTWRLKLAQKFSQKIFTASAESLRLESKKIVAVGHGIDAARFATKRDWRSAERILSVGRISPIKDFETLLRTGLPVTIVGRPIMSGDAEYFEKLKQYSNANFEGFVPYIKMPEYYANADIFVNCSPTGGIDKAVLEAMASGCIVLVCNEAFRNDLPPELFFKDGDSANLADAIRRVQSKSPQELQSLSGALLQRVRSKHALTATIHNIAKHIAF
ncbi:MAG: glycosyltransferase family 4 protein [Patescibacteria group bacterium]